MKTLKLWSVVAAFGAAFGLCMYLMRDNLIVRDIVYNTETAAKDAVAVGNTNFTQVGWATVAERPVWDFRQSVWLVAHIKRDGTKGTNVALCCTAPRGHKLPKDLVFGDKIFLVQRATGSEYEYVSFVMSKDEYLKAISKDVPVW